MMPGGPIRSAFLAALLALAAAALAADASPSGRAPAHPCLHLQAPQALHAPAGPPMFFRDVLPILQDHCQECHRPEGTAKPPLVSYEQAQQNAADIRTAAERKTMPPWFADARFGHFSNDPSLTPEQVAAISAWEAAGAPAGDPASAPPLRQWAGGWNIPQPDAIVAMPAPVAIPARGEMEYTYEIVPTG